MLRQALFDLRLEATEALEVLGVDEEDVALGDIGAAGKADATGAHRVLEQRGQLRRVEALASQRPDRPLERVPQK